jgi:hypothetical protein
MAGSVCATPSAGLSIFLAGDEGAALSKTRSRLLGANVGTWGNVRRLGPDCQHDADCHSLPKAGGKDGL